MKNKNTIGSESSMIFRERITNEYNKQVAETNQFMDLINSTLCSDDTIQKLENLSKIRVDIVYSKDKWLVPYLNDIDAEIENLKTLHSIGLLHPQTDQSHTDLSGFMEQLKPYFQDCSLSDLETILKHKQLPIGRNKILWTGRKSDAMRFAVHFQMTNEQFNGIFFFANNIKLHNKNKHKDDGRSRLSEILDKYQK